MKICWDNLEKLEYRPDRGDWQDKRNKGHYYIYNDSCGNCGLPFLSIKRKRQGIFCNHSCATTGKNNPFYGKVYKGKNSPVWKGGYRTHNIPLYDTYALQISFCEEVRRSKDPNILEVKCAYCGKWYVPLLSSMNNRIQALNGNSFGEYRFYCSDECKQECPIYNQKLYPKGFKPATSREVQPQLRQMCFERDNYICQKCGKTQDELEVGLHCHHVEGIRWEPLESADLDKVITFCKNCHIDVHKQPDCGYYDMRCPK